ncbi:uncharacterized protein LOC144435129 isoform X2 [Glandiceps talaboti]
MAMSQDGTSSKHYQTSAMSMMGDITEFFDSQMQALYTLSESMITMDRFNSDFVSMIKMDGKPIPPPMMTPDRIEEMRKYKQQAVDLEAKLQDHKKKRLLEKVQAVVDSIDERKTQHPGGGCTPECSPVIGDESSREVDSGMGSSYRHTLSESSMSRETMSSTPIERIPEIQDTKTKQEDTLLDDSGNVSASGQPILHLDATDDLVTSGYKSTSSSSDISELNRTVIAVNESDESLPSSSESSNTVKEKEDSPSSVRTSTSEYEDAESPISLSSQESEDERKEEIEPDEDKREVSEMEMRFQDFPPVSDTESAISLIGDYTPLPMPGPSQTPDLSAIRPSTSQSDTQLENSVVLSDDHSDFKSVTPNIETDHHEDEVKQLTSTGSSDQMTYGSAAVSCSLPISCVTDSADTLRDIEESIDTMNDEVLPDKDSWKVRGAPVGQENGGDQSKYVALSSMSGTSQSDDVSPPVTVRRRGSYTLNEPSPALVKAHSDREESYDYERDLSQESLQNATARRSLEFTNDKNEGQKEENDKQIIHIRKNKNIAKQTDSGNCHAEHVEQPSRDIREMSSAQRGVHRGATPEDLLVEFQCKQFEYLEQLRIQLLDQQKQQLQQLLEQQQQEQLILQKEFEDQETRFLEEQRIVVDEVTKTQEKTENEQWLEKMAQLRQLEGRGDSDSESTGCSRPGYSDSLESSVGQQDNSTTQHSANFRPHTADPSMMRYPFYLEGQLKPATMSDTSSNSTNSPQLSVSTPLMSSSPQSRAIVRKVASKTLKSKFDRVSAAVKGYLTRRLMRTDKVQAIVKTVRDTYSFVYEFQEETPVKRGNLSLQDTKLAERVIAQLRAALLDMHDIFFVIPVQERMAIICHDRSLVEERRLKKQKQGPNQRISAVTKKVMERRKQTKAVNVNQTTSRPKTAPPTVSTMKKTPFDARVLKPIQGIQSPRRPADNLYRPSKYSSNKQENRPKTAPERTKDNIVMQAIGSVKGLSSRPTSTAVTAKSKGARRSLYPVSTVSTKARPRSPRSKTTKRKV